MSRVSFFPRAKGQLISKANHQAVNSSKKRTNEFVFTTMRRVFVRFLEEIEDTKKTFRNYLTFRLDLYVCQVSRQHYLDMNIRPNVHIGISQNV